MKNTIFFSWQSDLPNNSNRGFIENCIVQAIKVINKKYDCILEISIDKDTINETGTPDIMNTIFSKIDKSKIFIADISIINPNTTGRKTPNPNVLLELGYAAKVLGWEKIICIYNTDYGNYEDIPFDLRFRRPLTYSLKDTEKPKVKKHLSNIIADTITTLDKKGLLYDEINDYIKVQIDTEIITLLNHFHKIIFGYTNEKPYKYINDFLKLDCKTIKKEIQKRKFIGFQVFKNFDNNAQNFRNLLNQIITSNYYQRELSVILIQLIKWIESFNKFISLRTSPNLFVNLNEETTEYFSIYGPDINPTNKESYILLRKLNNEYGQVVDFGDFQEREKVDKHLEYQELNVKYTDSYSSYIIELIRGVTKWLDFTNSTFLIDDNNFEFKPQNILKQGAELIKAETVNLWNLFTYIFRINYDKIFGFENLFSLNFMKLFLNYGYIFKNHEVVVRNLNRQIFACIKPNKIATIEEFAIIYDVEDSIIENKPTKDGALKFKNAKNGIVEINSIFLDKLFLEYIEICLKSLKDKQIAKRIKEEISQLLIININNLVENMLPILENNVIEHCTLSADRNINIQKAFNDFSRINIDISNQINALKNEIRNHLEYEQKERN